MTDPIKKGKFYRVVIKGFSDVLDLTFIALADGDEGDMLKIYKCLIIEDTQEKIKPYIRTVICNPPYITSLEFKPEWIYHKRLAKLILGS